MAPLRGLIGFRNGLSTKMALLTELLATAQPPQDASPVVGDIFPPGKQFVALAIPSSAFRGRGVQPGRCGTRSAQESEKRAPRPGIFMPSAVASRHGDLRRLLL